MSEDLQNDGQVLDGQEEARLFPPASGLAEPAGSELAGLGSEPAGSGPAQTLRSGNVSNLTNMGKGRTKGQVNKITKTFKEAAERAFEEGGGVEWLVKMMNGTASDRAAVMGLFGRLIPAQLQAQVDTTVRVELNWLGGRGIGRVTDADVKALDAPQMLASNVAQAAVGNVVDAVLVDAAGQAGGEGQG